MCHFVLVFFSPFSIAITSLGEERANLSVFDLCLFGFVGFLFPGSFLLPKLSFDFECHPGKIPSGKKILLSGFRFN